MIARDDDEFSVDHDSPNDSNENSVDEEVRETTESETNSDEDFLDSEETFPDQSASHLVQNMHQFLDNPSITTRPQIPTQVDLDSVQNLDEVFDNIYNAAQTQSVNPSRASSRLSSKPKPNYLDMHRGRQ